MTLPDTLKRSLSLTTATFLVISSVIGSGIFFTPGIVAAQLPNPSAILLLWILGGFLSWCGALANAELGAMFPRAGGNYVYLREAFHPLAGFLVGWLTFFVIYVGTIVTLAIAFAAGITQLMGINAAMNVWLAMIVILLVSIINILGVQWGALANNLTATFKVIALLILVVMTPFFGETAWYARLIHSENNNFSLVAFGSAMSPVLFSYLGWNAAIYVASEIKNPERNIPAALFIGLATCIVIYLAINLVYLFVLPMEQLIKTSNTGVAVATILFGAIGGKIIGILIIGSILGTLNAMILIGPRIIYAMALDQLFFRSVAITHSHYNTPHIAIIVQAIAAMVLLWFTEYYRDSPFISALSYTTFAIVLATIADILALYMLRWRLPHYPRAYKSMGYPWLPGIYMLANIVIAASLLWTRPSECIIGLLVVGLGIPMYLIFSTTSMRHSS